MVGSFLNVVIYRLPVHMIAEWLEMARDVMLEYAKVDEKHLPLPSTEKFNIAFPASHCPKCKAPIKPWHNIPVISYLFLLKGKCHACKDKISPRYPIIEAVTGLLSVFVVYKFGLTWESALVLLFTWSLIVLTMIDIDKQLLPDDITLPLMWIGLLANISGLFTDVSSAVIGAVAGYMTLWCVYWLFKILTKKEGMGYGDFKLLAALGAWMGWQALPLIIILSSMVGAVIGIAGIIIMGKDKSKPMPFGPYLAIAGWIAFFWGDVISAAYLDTLK
ncbi:MAG: A24 family peptidase [Agarilytica sp.]